MKLLKLVVTVTQLSSIMVYISYRNYVLHEHHYLYRSKFGSSSATLDRDETNASGTKTLLQPESEPSGGTNETPSKDDDM